MSETPPDAASPNSDSTSPAWQRVAAMALLGELVSGIAHEMRSPLSYLKVNIEWLTSELRQSFGQTELNDERTELREELDDVQSDCETGMQRITGMLDSLRACLGVGGSQEKSSTVVQQTVEDAVRLVGCRWKHAVHIHVTATHPECSIPANSGRLCQAIMHLLVNAIEATGGKGQVELRVDSSAPSEVRISVSDNGTGVEPAAVEKMYELFYTSKDPGSHAGLGLALAKAVAESHGGTLNHAANTPSGTTFTLTLAK